MECMIYYVDEEKRGCMFISTIHSFDSLKKLKESGIDAIIVGIPTFSIRHSIEVNVKDLYQWKQKCKELNLQLYVNCTKFVHENEIELLKDTLKQLKEIDVDGIYYGDEGVLFEAKQLGIENKLIYQPETLVTSSNDVEFYLNEGLLSVSLAHELSLEEIISIGKKFHQIEILIHGYYSIMYSRRPLIQNYFDAIQKEIDLNRAYTLIEQTRMDRMPIVQDKTGTNVFSELPIGSFRQLNTFKEIGLYRFRIDSIFFDDDWTCEVMKSYQNGTQYGTFDDSWYTKESILKKGV